MIKRYPFVTYLTNNDRIYKTVQYKHIGINGDLRRSHGFLVLFMNRETYFDEEWEVWEYIDHYHTALRG